MDELAPGIPTSLLPLILVLSYLAVAMMAFAVRTRLNGGWRDKEVAGRGESALLPMWSRQFFVWAVQPVWYVVRRTGIPADAITTLSALLAIGTGLSVAAGHFALGGWLYLAAGLCDFLDGRLARAAGTASKRGAAIDSILDRYSDSAVLVGLGWYFRESWTLAVVMMALVGTLLVPYVRARGEGLGVDVRVGLMQRPERVVLLGASLALGPAVDAVMGRSIHQTVIVAALTFVAVATQATALHRFAHLLRRLDGARRRAPTSRPFRVARAIVSSGVATGADFVVVSALVALAGLQVWFATGLGCLVGAGLNFSINRVWTFRSKEARVPQAARYTIVSTTSALLNSGGVAVALLLPWPDYRPAWLLVRAVVFLCWNYPLHRDYVYASPPPKPVEDDGAAARATDDGDVPEPPDSLPKLARG